MNIWRADKALAHHSYYEATAPRTERFDTLQDDIRCDVAIVGGGLAGLSAAIELADRGYSVTLLEARQIGSGASGRNGGQALSGLASDQPAIEEQLGMADARRIFSMTLEAIDLIVQRCQRFDINCEWQPGYLYLAINERKARALQEWQAHLHKNYDDHSEWITPDELPRWIDSPRFHSGLHDPRSGHLHPLKYTLGLARAASSLGVRLFENTEVTGLVPGEPARLQTPQGEVRASHVLLAGNVYLQGLAPELAPRIMPIGTYIVASAPLDPDLLHSLIPSRSAVCDNNFVLDYFRPTADHRMLYGGGASSTTTRPINMAASMQRCMACSFPQLKNTPVEYAWGGFVDISVSRTPDFGRLHRNIYYLQGFSGHGLALTGLAGKLVAEAIAGSAERFDTFARLRHRSFPGGPLLRTPALALGMSYYQLRDRL